MRVWCSTFGAWAFGSPFVPNQAPGYPPPLSPQVYYAATGAPHMNPVPELLRHLKSVKTPLSEHKKGR